MMDKAYQWEEMQENLFTTTPAQSAAFVDDSNASNGRSLMLSVDSKFLEAYYKLPLDVSGGRTTVPTNFADRYRVYVVVRAEPTNASGSIVVELNNLDEKRTNYKKPFDLNPTIRTHIRHYIWAHTISSQARNYGFGLAIRFTLLISTGYSSSLRSSNRFGLKNSLFFH